MKQSSSAKYQHIRANLEAAIRNGEFVAGEQLPTEQALADRYGVSYLTARRAVCELVEADLLERRARKGTFVRSHTPQPVTTTTISLITSSYDHALTREFVNRGVRLAEQHHWQPNIIRLSARQQDAAVRAIRNGDLALVLLDEIASHSALAHAMRAAKGRAICVGSPTQNAGVSCIFNDPDEVFKTAVDYLMSQGHSDMMLVSQRADVAWTEIQSHSWRQATSDLWSAEVADTKRIPVDTAWFDCPTYDAYDAVREFLEQDHQGVTAFVGSGDEITQGILAAIRDIGKSVPDDYSVLNILDGPSMCFSHPPVTSIDMNFPRQFEIAFELLEAAQCGNTGTPQNHYVQPRIIERRSIRTLPPLTGSIVSTPSSHQRA